MAGVFRVYRNALGVSSSVRDGVIAEFNLLSGRSCHSGAVVDERGIAVECTGSGRNVECVGTDLMYLRCAFTDRFVGYVGDLNLFLVVLVWKFICAFVGGAHEEVCSFQAVE